MPPKKKAKKKTVKKPKGAAPLAAANSAAAKASLAPPLFPPLAPSKVLAIQHFSPLEASHRKQEIQNRLKTISVSTDVLKRKNTTNSEIAAQYKKDTHWDFLLKELRWLAADFSAERNRHRTSRNKLANGVRHYWDTQERREQKALEDAVVAQRKRAKAHGRLVMQWWGRIEKVVTATQKQDMQQGLQQRMNQQLIKLIHQTEQYTQSLSHSAHESSKSSRLIEMALQERRRRRSQQVTDYNRVQLEEENVSLYGETTDGSSSESEYSWESQRDDETTLALAEQEERKSGQWQDTMNKLRQEAEMDIDLVLERLKEEKSGDADVEDEEVALDVSMASNTRTVRFAEDSPVSSDDESAVFDQTLVDDETTMLAEEALPQEQSPSEEMAQLRADQELSLEELRAKYSGAGIQPIVVASSSRRSERSRGSLNEQEEENEEAYEPETNVVDDETTIAAEEQLGRDMSYTQELDMLKKENEIPVEQLRAMYAEMESSSTGGVLNSNADVDGDADMDDVGSDMSQDGAVSLSDSMQRSDTYMLLPSPPRKADLQEEDDEFQPEVMVDDETTIAAEERLGRDETYEEEIAALEEENEMSVDELRMRYAAVLSGPETTVGLLENAQEDVENDGEYRPDGIELDDETTIAAEERMGGGIKPEEEINLLKRESEVPIEELRRQYRLMEQDEDDERSSDEEGTENNAPKRQRLDREVEDQALKRLEQNSEMAQNTLVSRPFLLSPWVKLRSYQHIGLNWMVSLQTRRLNGILADEMGLGKTLQTISLFAYLAAFKGLWGPHLVIVPTSVIVNWETEFKRFCPGFKILCYYGSAKRRKELRTGWTKSNWYHVVITSYQLAVQDAFAFKRKKWYYMVLDEAQNIKNFQSQRWQTLIHFNTQRRLLLTGTPLQNNLMELWSLLHFLMPHIFRSRKEFSFWFANPMNNMIEGTSDHNNSVVDRLHGIIRPFVLRRLKKDVETQMPGKYEHIVPCQLSRRQMLIYEEFMGRSSTRVALKKGGNFMGMMNVLMQLRKVCNHPDLFEPRPVVTPFVMEPLAFRVPACASNVHRSGLLFESVGDTLLCPLWSGSQGLPSLGAMLRHDEIESSELEELSHNIEQCDPPYDRPHTEQNFSESLKTLIAENQRDAYHRRGSAVLFQNKISRRRCVARKSLVSFSLLDAVDKVKSHSNTRCSFSTPQQLLGLKRNLSQRASDVSDLVKRFVFCVPKAGAAAPFLETMQPEDHQSQSMVSSVQDAFQSYMEPYEQAATRLSSFFPDKKLVQYDAGKLQTLSGLLRELKKGGHRALIFTQMSKMLDILEAFLNLNGHTYLRLDGSTGVDQRQRLMDRFNTDSKVFCMILSTRSGGTGVNLTGADSVIFYDQDWNPASDAQASARAHRIGQTREVHIFRLVTRHTIEENILRKAQQKRNLDVLVMDRGNFDAKKLFNHSQRFDGNPDTSDVLTKGGLRAVLGVEETEVNAETDCEEEQSPTTGQLENVMETLEDADDVLALKGAKQEAQEELKEFDESRPMEVEPDEEAAREEKSRHNDESMAEKERLEKEISSWQDDEAFDHALVAASLAPTERYGLKFKTDIDPYYSVFAVMEYQRKLEAEDEDNNDINVEELEERKAKEEEAAIEEGDILGTKTTPECLIRQRDLYSRERSRLRAGVKLRKITGENWEVREDGMSGHPFWFNVDTGEARWGKPAELIHLESLHLAKEKGWGFFPLDSLKHVMGFLDPLPDRISSSLVSHHWKIAAADISFVRHVYPVEMGAFTRDDNKMHSNHYRTIEDAVLDSLPGDTIELSDGHYWIQKELSVSVPIRLIGDEHNPSNVVVEVNENLLWLAKSGWCEGITWRRPRITGSERKESPLVVVGSTGKVDMIESVIDNSFCPGPAVRLIGPSSKGVWENVIVKGLVESDAEATLVQNGVK